MRLDPVFVKQQVEMLKLSHPEIWEDNDEQLIFDSLEGETDLHEFLRKLEQRRQNIVDRANGIDIRIKILSERRGRFERGDEVMRKLIFDLMQTAGLKKVELPIATLSVRNGVPRVIITDELAIPDSLCRFKREPDKTKIKEALSDGPVTGATLSNIEPTLSIRTK